MRISDWSSDVCSSDLNDGLAHGRYFFMDIAREGIALYQADDSELHKPKPKTPQQAYDMAKGYYDQWFGLAVSSRMGFQFFYQAKQYPDAAYNLQQACERLYYCILLVFTFRSEEHTSELQSLMRNSYAVFCLK